MRADLCFCRETQSSTRPLLQYPVLYCSPLCFTAVPGPLAVILKVDVFVVVCRGKASMLASLIAQMQESADQVQKDVLRSEELLAVVRTLRLLRQGLCLRQSHHQCPLLPPGK